MRNFDDWLGECRAALSQAERLSAQLARSGGGEALRLGDLRFRIANLRAAIEALDALRTTGPASETAAIHPDWRKFASRSPWCEPMRDD